MKSAKNLKRMSIGKQKGKDDIHMSKPAMSFDTSTPDMGDRRTKVAKGLMVKK